MSRHSSARSSVSTRRASTPGGSGSRGRWRRFISRSGISGCHEATSRSTRRRVTSASVGTQLDRGLALVDPRDSVRRERTPHDRACVLERDQPDRPHDDGLPGVHRGQVEAPRARPGRAGRPVPGARARPGRRAAPAARAARAPRPRPVRRPGDGGRRRARRQRNRPARPRPPGTRPARWRGRRRPAASPCGRA